MKVDWLAALKAFGALLGLAAVIAYLVSWAAVETYYGWRGLLWYAFAHLTLYLFGTFYSAAANDHRRKRERASLAEEKADV